MTDIESSNTTDDLSAHANSSTYSGVSNSTDISIWDNPMSRSTSEDDVAFPMTPLLRRNPTFVPLVRHATSIASVAFLVPSADSHLRQATVMAATFNMTATIIGGGVLSIPLSCARAGILPFTALMIVSAIMTDFSLYLLCSCTRRTGSMTYGKVARSAVGPSLELASTAIIFFLVGFIVVGLMILNQGIWAPTIMAFISTFKGEQPHPTTSLEETIVLAVLVVLMLPFLLKRNLTSLRHICYVGFFSIVVLNVAMAYRAAEKNITNAGLFKAKVSWYTSNYADVLNALPIILLAFLCSFNIISVHCSLVDATRERVQEVIHKAVFLSFCVMYVFGLAGYLYAYEETNGNILLNFDPSDNIILLGRIGCGITTLFALPMNLLPCREALLSLISQIQEKTMKSESTLSVEERKSLLARRSRDDSLSDMQNDSPRILPKSETPPITASERPSQSNNYNAISDTAPIVLSPSKQETKVPQKQNDAEVLSPEERAIHWVTTLSILSVCFVAAVLAPNVAIVWDIAGSSMAFLIQFIIPAVCYIRLKRKVGRATKRVVHAWFLLITAILGGVVCTSLTIWRLTSN